MPRGPLEVNGRGCWRVWQVLSGDPAVGQDPREALCSHKWVSSQVQCPGLLAQVLGNLIPKAHPLQGGSLGQEAPFLPWGADPSSGGKGEGSGCQLWSDLGIIRHLWNLSLNLQPTFSRENLGFLEDSQRPRWVVQAKRAWEGLLLTITELGGERKTAGITKRSQNVWDPLKTCEMELQVFFLCYLAHCGHIFSKLELRN